MSGNTSRNKGRRGEREAALLLEARGYFVQKLSSGTSGVDLSAEYGGERWLVEVKKCRSLAIDAWLGQLRQRARHRPWMLLAKLPQSHSWLVYRKGMEPKVWDET